MADNLFDDPALTLTGPVIPLTDEDRAIIDSIDSSGSEIYRSNSTTAVAASEGSAIAGIAAETAPDRALAVQTAAAQALVPGIDAGQLIRGVTSGLLLNSVQGAALNLSLQNPNNITAQTVSQILGQTIGSASQQNQNTLVNPLHDYESYTYGLSLHLLTQQQYNTLMENPSNTYVPQNVLVASAGKYSPTFKRNSFFNEDFFFENLSMTNTVNITTMNRNSNVFQVNFTIIEPNGFTFINRLLDAVQNVGGKNYLRQPYLLQIDFYGYKDGRIASAGPIPGQSKYIPITLVGMKSKVTSKGAEYTIDAVPYNHQALNTVNVITPAAFQVKAKTVQDLLGTGAVVSGLVDLFTAGQREADQAAKLQDSLLAGSLSSQDADRLYQYLAKKGSGASGQFVASGLTDQLNSWQQSLAKLNKVILIPNQYKVIFDDEIGSSLIYPKDVPNDKNNVATGSTNNQTATNNVKAAAGLPVGGVDWSAGVFNIKMGTPIDKVIDYAVRNSDYIRKQLADPNGGSDKDISTFQLKLGNSLRWYRIIPSIKINQYDPSRDQYSYTITYYVKPWTVNTKHPYAPQGRTPGFVKRYDYLYTGQNKDVIDCSIDFDMLYYIQLTAFKNKLRTSETGSTDAPPGRADTPLVGPNSYQSDRLQPVQINYVASDLKLENRTGAYQANAVAGAEVQRDLMISSKGDMINVKLKIVGDSQLIMQDDVFFGQNAVNNAGQLTPNNSLYFTNGELYVFLNFQSPIDYNEETGLAVPGLGRYQYSEFTGIYKIVTVDSSFSRGKFEQTLDLVRLPISDQLRNQVTNARSRADTYVNYGLGQLTALPYTRFTGPRIIVNNLASGGLFGAGGNGLNGLVGQIANKIVGQAINQVTGKISTAITDFLNRPTILAPGVDQALTGYLESGFATGIDTVASAGLEDYFTSAAASAGDAIGLISGEGIEVTTEILAGGADYLGGGFGGFF